jgi:hypothetical protein
LADVQFAGAENFALSLTLFSWSFGQEHNGLHRRGLVTNPGRVIGLVMLLMVAAAARVSSRGIME